MWNICVYDMLYNNLEVLVCLFTYNMHKFALP